MQIGVMKLQMTQHDGMRISTNAAFIRPIRYKRKNLTVRTQAHVLRVLINSKHEAFGVEYLDTQTNVVKTVYARKEVILSAGSLNSPKILMLSGIGPRRHLGQFGIETVSDLPVTNLRSSNTYQQHDDSSSPFPRFPLAPLLQSPNLNLYLKRITKRNKFQVGHNLQDHATMDGVVIGLHPNVTATNAEVKQMIQDVYKYLHTKMGPLSATGPLSVGAFVQSSYEFEHKYR